MALVVILGALLYANSLQVPFYLDDYREIVFSPMIKDLSSFIHNLSTGGIGALFSRSFGCLTFAINYQFSGLNVFGYHLVNIVIHLMAALLVFRLVSLTLQTPHFVTGSDKNTIGKRLNFIAFLAALLFVAHPLQTSAVTYIIQRYASLVALLYMISFSFYVQARIIMKGPVKRYVACAALFLAALVSAMLAFMTKQNAVTLPLVIILYEMMFFPDNIKKKAKFIGMLFTASLIGISIIIVASGKPIGILLAKLDRATTVEPAISRLDYLATQMRVLVTYLRLLLFPVDQQLDYNYTIATGFLNAQVLMSSALLFTLFSIAVYCLVLAQRKAGRFGGATPLLRIISFGIFWFFITHLVESSIIPITDVIFEHRMYLPSAGLFMAIAAAVFLAGNTSPLASGWPRRAFLSGIVIVILTLGGLTIARNHLWRDEISFWEDNASKSPFNGRVFNNLGNARLKKRDLHGAEQAYLKAIELRDYQDATFVNLGQLYAQWGNDDKALKLFRAALLINPELAEAYNSIGSIYANQNMTEEAIQDFLKAVKLQPNLSSAYNNLGLMYRRQNKYAEAIEIYGKAIKRNPDVVSAYINRGQLLLTMERRGEAISDFRRVLELDPANVTALAQLRWLLDGKP